MRTVERRRIPISTIAKLQGSFASFFSKKEDFPCLRLGLYRGERRFETPLAFRQAS